MKREGLASNLLTRSAAVGTDVDGMAHGEVRRQHQAAADLTYSTQPAISAQTHETLVSFLSLI